MLAHQDPDLVIYTGVYQPPESLFYGFVVLLCAAKQGLEAGGGVRDKGGNGFVYDEQVGSGGHVYCCDDGLKVVPIDLGNG